jgi:hypothetical protein
MDLAAAGGPNSNIVATVLARSFAGAGIEEPPANTGF